MNQWQGIRLGEPQSNGRVAVARREAGAIHLSKTRDEQVFDNFTNVKPNPRSCVDLRDRGKCCQRLQSRGKATLCLRLVVALVVASVAWHLRLVKAGRD